MILCGLVLVSILTEDALRSYSINYASYGTLVISVTEIVWLLRVFNTNMFLRKTSIYIRDHSNRDWAPSAALGLQHFSDL